MAPAAPASRRAEGRLGQEVKAIALAAEALKGEVPILQTLFGPLTTAYKLAGDRVFADLRRHPDLFEAGLAIIAETTLAFARACLAAGAHGVFFSTQCASYRMLSEAEHLRLRRHLRPPRPRWARGRIALHHAAPARQRRDVRPDAGLPGQHGELARPQGRTHPGRSGEPFGGLLVGGLNEDVTLPQGPVEAIKAEVRDAIAQTGGRRLMIAPGCVIPIATPESHYRAVIEAVSEMAR